MTLFKEDAMKKILTIIIALVVCFMMQASVFAENVSDVTTETITEYPEEMPEKLPSEPSVPEHDSIVTISTEAAADSPEEVTVPSVTEEYHTLFTRIWEYVNTHRDMIIDVAGFAVLFIMSVWSAILRKKSNGVIKDSFSRIGGNTSSVAKSQQGVVSVVNELIGGYEKLDASYKEVAAAEDERNRLVGAMVVQNATILEILTSVYANSKNLPQGVKDIVHLKYAKCMKALEDDEKLRACVLAVRDIVNEEDSITEEV
jgi:hypothetical protein